MAETGASVGAGRGLPVVAAVLAVVGGLLALLLGAGMVFSQAPDLGLGGRLDRSKVPAELVGLIETAAGTCPEVSAPLLAAQLQAESGFRARAESIAGAQGIAQFLPGTWAEVGRDADGDGRADPFDPGDAIPAQAQYMCELASQLRGAGLGRDGTGGEDLVDLTLAAYNAGPGAVLAYGGVPPYAETTAYVRRIRALQAQLTVGLPGAAERAEDGSWPAEACSIRPDPTTGRGCLTPRTAALVTRLKAAGYSRISCWDEHPWNPTSDHPQGRACDVAFGPGGQRPAPAEKAAGDHLAAQLQAAAGDVGISYLIWSGRIWSVERAGESWRPYDGGGVYDPSDPTGGHYDHIHISMY